MVLVIDDDESICELITEILEGRGFKVESRTSVPDALKALQANQFELVISDLNLITGKGTSIEKYMRLKNSPHEKTPFLYISGDIDGIKRLPQSSHSLSKPFGVNALMEKIEELLNAKNQSKESAGEKPEKKKPMHPELAKLLKGGKS